MNKRTDPLYYLPSDTAAPTLNLTIRLSLTLTLLLLGTLNYRRAAHHPNRLRSPFCTKTRSNTLHQQQVHNKSYKWSLGCNVNGRTFRVFAVRLTYRMAYIHHVATDGAHVCQVAYTISRDVHHSLTSFIP